MATPEIEQQPPHPLLRQPLPAYHPSPATISIQPSPLADDLPNSKPERHQPPTRRRRRHRSSIAYHAVGVLGLAWSTLCIVRYSLAVSEFHDDRIRENYAVAFVVLSVLGWLAIACIQSVRVLKIPIPRWNVWEQVGLLFASLCILTPGLFNLAFVALWRRSGVPVSLAGRCHWDIDVVWSGRSGECAHGVPWGAWLVGAILRVVFTLTGLSAMHTLAWISNGAYDRSTRSTSRPRSHSTQSLVDSNSRSSPNRLRKKQSPTPQSPPDSIQDHRRTFSSSTGTHQMAQPVYSPNQVVYTPNHFLRSGSPTPVNPPPRSPSRMGQHAPMPSPRSSDDRPRSISPIEPRRSTSLDSYPEQDDGGDLNRFAVNFRSLVERVTRETEDGSRLPPSPTSPRHRSETPPSSFPGGRTSPSAGRASPGPNGRTSPMDPQMQLQRDLLQAHRLMLIEQAMRAESYEHVVVLGGAVRRMSTIPSIADSSVDPPWTPNSANSQAVSLVRSPTGSTARSGRRPVGRKERERGEGHTPPSTGGSGDSPEEEG